MSVTKSAGIKELWQLHSRASAKPAGLDDSQNLSGFGKSALKHYKSQVWCNYSLYLCRSW